MNKNPKREAAAAAFQRLLIARHWQNLEVDRVIIHEPPPDPFAIAAARVFACPAWREQNAVLDALRAEFPGSDGKLAQLQIEGEPVSLKVRKSRLLR